MWLGLAQGFLPIGGGGGGGITMGLRNGLSISGGWGELGGGSLIHDTTLPIAGLNFDVTNLGNIVLRMAGGSNKYWLGDETKVAMVYLDGNAGFSALGDYHNQGNSNYILVQDTNEQAFFQIAGYSGASVGDVLSLANTSDGEVAWVSGSSLVPILPDTQIAFGNGVDPYTSTPDFVYDVIGGIFNVEFSAGFGSKINITDNAASVISVETNKTFYVSDISDNVFFNVDVAAHGITIGDYTGTFNFTALSVVIDNEEIDLQAKVVNQGDIGGSGNSTTISLVDASNLIQIQSKGDIEVGDLNNLGNNTYLKNADASQLLTYQKGIDLYLSLDIANGVYNMGALSAGNANFIGVDDTGNNININSKGTVLIGDLFAAANGTKIIQDDATQVLTYQKGTYVYLCADIVNQSYGIGDLSIQGNKNYVSLYGTVPFSAVSLQSQNYILIGDGDGVTNSTVLTLDNNNQLLTYQKGSDVWFSTDIANAAGFWGVPSASLNYSFDGVAFTTTINAPNDSKIFLDGNNGIATIRVGGVDVLAINAGGGIFGAVGFGVGVNADGGAAVTTLGDWNNDLATGCQISIAPLTNIITLQAGTTNGTKGVWDDANEDITLQSPGTINIGNAGGNGTKTLWDDPSQKITFSESGNDMVVFDFNNGQYKIGRSVNAANIYVDNSAAQSVSLGDVFNASNGTKGVWDDAAQTIVMSAANGFGIGGTPNSVSLLDVQSTTKGVKFPSMTTAQRTAITTTNIAGLVVYDTDIDGLFCTNNAGNWVQL